MQIFLRLQNFASYQNFRAPTILVKQFSGEKQNLSPSFLIQIEGQEEQRSTSSEEEEQQDKQQREQQEEQQEERRSRK